MNNQEKEQTANFHENAAEKQETNANVQEQVKPEEPATSQEEVAAPEETTENVEPSELEKAKLQLAQLQENLEQLQDKYLRQAAEFDNYRKRTIKEKAELIKNASEKLMTAILPVLDDMDRAFDNMAKSNDTAACCEGFKLIDRNFKNILTQNGLQKIETEGQPFDTDYHEAIALIPAASDEQKGKILDCVQPGYKLNEKVIRHAKVAVGQ